MNVPQVWAISQAGLPELTARLRSGPHGALAHRRKPDAGQDAPKRVALVNIFGVLNQWPSWFADTSTVEVQAAVRKAAADPSVDCIVMNMCSPGGSVFGIQELSDAIYAARQQKPIYAIANSLMCSAGYWIGSAATKCYAAPGAWTGSIGCVAVHYDQSGMNEQLGIKPTYIATPPGKVEDNPDEPLTPEARANVEKMVNDAYRDFVRAVARNRGVKATTVMGSYGQGRVVGAFDAKAAGMIDGIKTLSDLLGSATSIASGRNSTAVEMAMRRQRWEAMQRESRN